jgi:hypothetical protein
MQEAKVRRMRKAGGNMPHDEGNPDQEVRATSSRLETTDDNQCSGSVDRIICTPRDE